MSFPRAWADIAKKLSRLAFLGALSEMSKGKVVPVPGGVSGATADEGDACAIEGIRAAGLEFKV